MYVEYGERNSVCYVPPSELLFFIHLSVTFPSSSVTYQTCYPASLLDTHLWFPTLLLLVNAYRSSHGQESNIGPYAAIPRLAIPYTIFLVTLGFDTTKTASA